ncbi:MAG: PAS domain S-box protein, partial [Bacteroidales bacterium]|nr:PAS domain S-box protein [Bacteroidales bacterium]
FEAMTGLKAEDIVGKTLLEVLPDTEDYWIKTYAKVVETGEPIHFENYANELRKFYEVKAFSPAPHKFVTITSDITEKKNTEINLRKSEEKFKSIIDSIPLALHLSTEVEQITEYVNPTMVKMFGYTQEEMPSVAQWWPLAYPDQNYRNFVSNEWNRRVASALETQMPIEPMEVVCTCKDGTKKNILWSFITASGLNYSMGLDITAQKEAEKELHESEERFRALHNASFGGITIHDEGIIIACNQGLSEMTGYSMEELIGMNGLNLISDKALDTVINNIKSGYEKPYESVCVRKDKTEFPVRIEARNIPYQGKMVRVTEFRDITEQKRFESELRDSEERFRLLVKNSSDIILMINEKGLLHYISLAMKAVTGYEPDAFLGKNILDSVHPDDIQSAREVWEKTIKNPDQTVSLQYRHIHKTKGWVYLEAIGQSFLDTPGINAVVVSLRDISHRKQAEMIDLLKFNITRSILNAKNFVDLLEIVRNELGLMFDTTNFFVAMYDAERDMLVNTINKDEKDWFDEWSAKESLSGFVVKSGNSVLMSRKEIEQFSAQNNIELIGAPASCWMGVPIKVENTILGVMAIQSYLDTEAFNKADLALLEMIAHEVGIFIERQNYLDKLLEAKEKAEESDKLKTAFINNISHEIRTPLNGIMGFGQLMAEEDITSEERAVYLKTLQNSSNRLMNTVTDIMDMAFLTSGSLKLNKQEFLLLPFLTNTVQKMREYCDSKNLELELLESSDAAKIMLNTEKELLGKVLLKLLDNAIKFTDVGKITIGYHFIKDQIEIFVSDTGRGVAADKLNFIFEMFIQEETALTRGYEGSGLGLAIASGIVDKLGGEMKVKSEKGKGSEFSFTIPVKGLKEEALSTSHPVGRSKNHFRPVILVAEDDESNYMLMEVIVRKTGSEYLHALNGEEAVEMCKQRPDISLVLMDIKMPVLNGIEATKIIRGFRPELPIIATTAFAQTGDETRILKMGFDGYYAKPIKPHILKELIEKYG